MNLNLWIWKSLLYASIKALRRQLIIAKASQELTDQDIAFFNNFIVPNITEEEFYYIFFLVEFRL